MMRAPEKRFITRSMSSSEGISAMAAMAESRPHRLLSKPRLLAYSDR